MEALILAGGFGTRLKNVVNEIPKPMAPVNGKPFLSYLFDYLKEYDIKKAVLCTGYLSEKIESYYNNKFNDIEIAYSVETSPLGTGGAVKKALELCGSESVITLNGDTFFDVDLNQLYAQHNRTNADLTLSLKPMRNFERYGIVNIDDENNILGFEEKKYREFGYINGGVYVIRKDIFKDKNMPEKFSLETDFFENNTTGKKFSGYVTDTYFIDIGIPEDYFKVQEDFKKLWS